MRHLDDPFANLLAGAARAVRDGFRVEVTDGLSEEERGRLPRRATDAVGRLRLRIEQTVADLRIRLSVLNPLGILTHAAAAKS
jgi:hypothetical protein